MHKVTGPYTLPQMHRHKHRCIHAHLCHTQNKHECFHVCCLSLYLPSLLPSAPLMLFALLLHFAQQELLDKATQPPAPNEQMLKVPLALYGSTSGGGAGAVETIMEGVPEQPAAAAGVPAAAAAPAAVPAAAGAPAAGAFVQQ